MGKLALFFGANDFGGTILEENVVTAAGEAHKPARAVEIIKVVASVGRSVAQRSTGYGLCDGFLEGSEFYLAIKMYLKFPMAGR